jgi:peptidoglycan-N-acetylglucosamine deacetylase
MSRAPWAMARRGLLAAAVGVVMALLGAGGLYRLARSRTVQVFGKLIARVETPRRMVALTFDDGPTPEAIDEVLRILESRRVRGTFFVNGANLERHPGLGRRLIAAGHELGNHTYSHDRMVLKSPAFIRSEIERTDALIRAEGQRDEILFRPPFGWKLVGLPWYLARTRRTTVTWDVDADAPPLGDDASRIASECLRRVRPGSIVLMHVWYRSRAPSRAALPAIVDGLQQGGFELVTLRELLAATAHAKMVDHRAGSRPHPQGG